MGGNAIKNVQRLNKSDYEKVQETLLPELQEVLQILEEKEILVIKAYRNKETFGDIDLIVQSDNLSNTWIQDLIDFFNLSEDDYSKNSNIFSFRYNAESEYNFQVDLIFTPKIKMESAYNYFNFNDFSNLIGRLSKKLGFKLGHDGLFYIERIGDHIISDIRFSTNYFDALEYLELDVQRYKSGFDSLEDIFEYVASSPYFNPDIYLLHNRNNVNRERDKKRLTYKKFLEYCQENKDDLCHYHYDRVDDYDGYGSKNNTRVEFTQKILEDYPVLNYEVLQNRADFILNQEFKKYFNGNIVSNKFNVKYKELGDMMKYYKQFNSTEKKIETIRNKCYNFHSELIKTN